MERKTIKGSGWMSDHSDDQTNRRRSARKRKGTRTSKNPEMEIIELDTQVHVKNNAFQELNMDSGRKGLIPTERKERLRKSNNVRSTDVDDDSIVQIPQPMDIIVDVHHDSAGAKPKPRQRSTIKYFDEKRSSSRTESRSKSLSDKRLEGRNKVEELEKIESDPIEESPDLIEELESSPRAGKDQTRNEERELKSLTRTSEEISSRRKQWITSEQTEDQITRTESSKKVPRKRWSKDASVIRLPESRKFSHEKLLPEFAMPPGKKSQKDNDKDTKRLISADDYSEALVAERNALGYDNIAFQSEEVLRIETSYNNKSTKIEMRSIDDTSDIENTPPIYGSPSSVSSTGDTIRESEKLFKRSAESFRKQKELATAETILSIEEGTEESENKISSKNSDRSGGGYSSGKRSGVSSGKKSVSSDRSRTKEKSRVKISGDDSNFAQSMEELTDGHPDPTEDRVARKGDGRSLRESKGKYSSHEATSTNESSDRVEDSHSEREDVSSVARKRKTSYVIEKSKRDSEKKDGDTGSSAQVLNSTAESELTKRKKKREKKKRDIRCISVTVHRTDLLEMDYITKHPMVKVHIVEASSGNYLKRMKDEENKRNYLQPIITGKFDFKEHRSMMPIWEEELIFEHDFEAVKATGNDQIIILFEVVDLLSFAEASFNYDRFGREGCWYKIAWAFLRPVGVNGVLHVNKRVRLQLYRPRRNSKKFGKHKCEVYTWWKSDSREKYPSSLFVTVTSVDPPKLEPVVYQQLNFDTSDALDDDLQKPSARNSELISLPKWSRLAAQSCKIPNDAYFETKISENGCFCIVFSNSGKYLACAVSDEYDYPIMVYEIEAHKIHVQFFGHKTFIYSLNWSNDDHLILSVSSDQTARLWDVHNKIVQYIQLLPHPSYVYCGKFDFVSSSVVATGCYDRIARIWVKIKGSKIFELSQELEGHEGYVNSLCFQKNNNLLTADSVGVVICWMMRTNRRMLLRKEWQIARKIKVREIEGVVINTLLLHPLGTRVLVHSRNNGLRMLDLATGIVLKKYSGLKNQRIQLMACVSPCGSLIFCGNEDSTINVWNLETGKQLAKYAFERNYRAVTCVDYHPYDHVLAFTTFGSPASAKVLRFNKDADGRAVGLTLLNESQVEANDEIVMSFRNLPLTSKERSRSSSNGKRNAKKVPRENHDSFQSLSSCRSNYRGSTDSVFQSVGEKRIETRLKLQRLNEAEESLKSKSTSRLFNIIEKIDRILLNTSRSSGDVETGLGVKTVQEKSATHERSDHNEIKRKRKKCRKPTYLESLRSSSYADSNGGSSSTRTEELELKVIGSNKENCLTTKKRSRSANERRLESSFEDLPKILSDSAVDPRKAANLQESDEDLKSDRSDSASDDLKNRPNSLNPIVMPKLELSNTDCSVDTTPESAGTYIVEKADFEINNDVTDRCGNNDPLNDRGKSVDRKSSKMSSDTSIQSNVTFTVENEVPIPKPRRKRII